MRSARSFHLVLLLLSLAVALPSAVAQIMVTTVAVGASPFGIAVNSVTNKTYVANLSCSSLPCPSPGTVTVIDGATDSTTTVTVGVYPYAIAVNPVTNKIYVANNCGNDLNCKSFSTVTVIDGVSNGTTTVAVGAFPDALAVNSVTNKIYVANDCGNDLTCRSGGTVTVIDGATNHTATVNVGNYPNDVEVNSVTNKIYITNQFSNSETVIDGASNNTTTVNVGSYPSSAAVDSVTDKIYVENDCGNDPMCHSGGTVTVIDGATNKTTTVTVGVSPDSIAVNAVTNQIYVANGCGNDLTCGSAGTVTVIDGASNNTTTVNVEFVPFAVAVDSVTNQIYVVNQCGNDVSCQSPGTVSVIDGVSNSVVSVAVGNQPVSEAVNATTNRIYVANHLDDTVSVIAGATGSVFTVLHNFTGGLDGANPQAGLTMDKAGNLYGTTFKGSAGYGVVYKLTHKGSGWIFNPLYTFAGGSDGAGPLARVSIGANGTLYGSTAAGGQGSCSIYGYTGCGTVFNLKPQSRACTAALCFWTKTALYTFAGSDGASPQGDLTFDQSGNLYGGTINGGSAGYGAIYELSPSNGSWTQALLYNAKNNGDGAYAWGGITFDTAGNIYGGFALNGPHGVGAIYELSPSGSSWTESTVYGFPNSGDGNMPEGGLIIDSSGNLYGTTTNGGSGGGGTVFELSPAMGGWTYNVLYSFTGCTGCGPLGRLVMDGAGNLYGTTYADGANGKGSVFKLTPSAGSWTYTSLYDFTGSSDGAYPWSNLVFDANGNLYGTASAGGTKGVGVVFEITP